MVAGSNSSLDIIYPVIFRHPCFPFLGQFSDVILRPTAPHQVSFGHCSALFNAHPARASAKWGTSRDLAMSQQKIWQVRGKLAPSLLQKLLVSRKDPVLLLSAESKTA